MTTKADIIKIARSYLRDFPRFFQKSFTPHGITYELEKPNIDGSSLWVASAASAGAVVLPPATYQIDERNGLLRLNQPLAGGQTLMVEGYYFEWLTNEDMSFFADMAINYNTHSLQTNIDNLAPAVIDVIGIHALVQALWGLVSEYSRDIDVITSESVHIIASQRYRMVSSLLEYWQAEYNRRAAALNIGLERLEVLNLRRVSRSTNRLVPLYRDREIEEFGPIERLWPELDKGIIVIEDLEDDLRIDVYVDGEPPPGYLSGGNF